MTIQKVSSLSIYINIVLTVRLLLPKYHSIRISTRFLYYFSVYVNLSKNSLMPIGFDFSLDSETQVNLSFSR